MKNLNIATWNIKNSYFKLKENNFKISAIKGLLEKENLDILALQEVNNILENNLRLDLLGGNYHLDSKKTNHKNTILGN